METVSVELAHRSYDIHIGGQLLARAGDFIQKLALSKRAAVITNSTVGPLYARRLSASLELAGITAPVITLPDGEIYKTLGSIERVYTGMLSSGLDRSSFLIALGGGVIGDMTGFAAATYMRGIPFIQVPTTLLAQVDSSIGGKTGVNLKEGKNLAGAFHQPRLVLIDPAVLMTLPSRELRSGFAEVIKTAVISDPDLFQYLDKHITNALAAGESVITRIIASCCRIKARITSLDETEQGIRAYLNFGHTIGHAIEALTGFSTYAHGEAVAIGMATISRISAEFGYCEPREAERLTQLLAHAGLPVALPDFSPQEYADAILKDKKKSADKVNMVFLTSIGSVEIHELTADELMKVLTTMLRKRMQL